MASQELQLLIDKVVPRCDDCAYYDTINCIDYRQTCQEIWHAIDILERREREVRHKAKVKEDGGWEKTRLPQTPTEYLVVTVYNKKPTIMRYCRDTYGKYWKDHTGKMYTVAEIKQWQKLPKA